MKRRAPRRQSPDRENRRQEIISAAVRLFAERGMENVTYGDIAKAAKLSRPLIYFYFPDLETLFLEAIVLGGAELHRRFQAAVRPTEQGLDQIMSIGRAYVGFARDEPAAFQLVAHNESKQSLDQEDHPLTQECQRYYDGIMGLLVTALQKGVRDGSIRPDLGDPGKVAICLWGLTHGLIQVSATKQSSIECKLGVPFPDLPDFGLDLIRRSLQAAKRRRRT
ncbi:MAG: TetR/AcrR family transcriptional regulator [Opitutales bacterium]